MDGPSLGRKRPRRARDPTAQPCDHNFNLCCSAANCKSRRRHSCCNAPNRGHPATVGTAPALASVRSHTPISPHFPCAKSPRLRQNEKRAVQRVDGPSLGRKRPRRARQCERGSAMSQCKISEADQRWEVQKLQGCHNFGGKRVRFCGRAGPEVGSTGQKEAVRASERPKSREETPVMGCGGEDVRPRNRNFCMRLFAASGNLR